MKISVIIPIKNRANLINETLQNIFKQSLRPYEVIVVDDGSTDNLKDILGIYERDILLVNNQGKGPGAARNTGYTLSTGDYIQFFDSDDLMTRNKILEQSALLKNNPKADFVYGPYVKAAYIGNKWQQKDVIMQYYPMAKGDDLVDNILKGWCSITQACLFRRELLEKVGPWRTDLMPHEDKEFWFRVGLHARNFIHENKSCVIYRQHENQITDKNINLLDRALDGVKAFDIIASQRIKRSSIHTTMLFDGYRAQSKKFINKLAKHQYQPLSKLELFSSYYYLFYSKLQRLQTGTPWGKMFGVLNSENLFQNVVKEI